MKRPRQDVFQAVGPEAAKWLSLNMLMMLLDITVNVLISRRKPSPALVTILSMVIFTLLIVAILKQTS
jgi:hypothetical protein